MTLTFFGHWRRKSDTAPTNRTADSNLNAVVAVLLLAFAATATQAQTTSPTSSLAPQQTATLAGTRTITSDANSTATAVLQVPQVSSSQYTDVTGLTAERLIETGFDRRADLLAARQRLSIAGGRATQAGLRPNPTLDAEYGSPRFLAGEAEQDLSIGVSQVFETGGKRGKRIAVARLELAQTRAEVTALERLFASEVRTSFARSIAFSRQLDALERLVGANVELVRVTNARLGEGDVAPLDLNLVRLETDRLRAQVIRTRADLESELISLRALVGFETTEPLRLAPAPDRPPRLDLSLTELTDLALRERADLQAARLGEELGRARIRLAESGAVPNVGASVRFSRSRELFDLPARLGGGDLSDSDNELTFGVSVELPIFNRNQGDIATASGERVQATRVREFLEATSGATWHLLTVAAARRRKLSSCTRRRSCRVPPIICEAFGRLTTSANILSSTWLMSNDV